MLRAGLCAAQLHSTSDSVTHIGCAHPHTLAAVGELSKRGKGRHTTTTVTLIRVGVAWVWFRVQLEFNSRWLASSSPKHEVIGHPGCKRSGWIT